MRRSQSGSRSVRRTCVAEEVSLCSRNWSGDVTEAHPMSRTTSVCERDEIELVKRGEICSGV